MTQVTLSPRSRVTSLKFEPYFCLVDNPRDLVNWEKRTAVILDEKGNVHFEQKDCEVPQNWSQLALNVVASKYFYGTPNTPERENSVWQLIHRVARTIADWGIEDGYFDRENGEVFYRELAALLLLQMASFNSPVWFNVGLYHIYGVKGSRINWRWSKEANEGVPAEDAYKYPQCSACFIQSVEDNMESIMQLARNEAMLFKYGSGTGTNLSTIRSSKESISGGGKPSGPLSFMRVYDQVAAVVRSGGKLRRAAKMQILNVDHPDILDFIECKVKEERKAKDLMKLGYSYEDAYRSVFYQNANLSVRVTDDFMKAVEEDRDWVTRFISDPSCEGPRYKARYLFRKIAESAWECGDPGLQFDTTINDWNPYINSGRINSSNPCSEHMALDDSACNLASINLMKFYIPGGHFDEQAFYHACRTIFIAQDILVDRSSYPTKKICEVSHHFRFLGLGYTNLGALIMAHGYPYDSPEARNLCSYVTSLLTGYAALTSTEIAEVLGPFTEFEKNRKPFLRIMRRHRSEAEKRITGKSDRAIRIWDEVISRGEQFGFRNAQFTVLAPTGTISFMMDCDTTGIEPDFALVKYKQLAGGGVLKIVNQTIPLALSNLGYTASEIDQIIAYIEDHNSIEGCPLLKSEHLAVFDCAVPAPGSQRAIPWKAHIEMMAAAQPFISAAISKTVNMPNSSTVEDVERAYMDAWKMGLKAIAIYRDGSKGHQPLSSGGKKEEKKEGQIIPIKNNGSLRKRLPTTRDAIIHKFTVGNIDGYLMVGKYETGAPGELFVVVSKEGSTIGGLMDCFATAISIGLQYGVPLQVFVEKFKYSKFEPMGFTDDPEIKTATSLVDYIFRWLEKEFLKSGSSGNGKVGGNGKYVRVPQLVSQPISIEAVEVAVDGPPCSNCGSVTYRSGACYSCRNCGETSGCG
ncbi:MAG: vitamin B12-dependent ribonucleotide reductase [Patescibacteria group bacterium]|nr:MAG: vitamin B12-dependent ribonucleotide reductase [Patescibacteria group bacterium]